MTQPDADLGMLWCAPKLRGFYMGCGWELMGTTVTLLGDTRDEAEVHDEELLFMRFFSEDAQARRSEFEGNQIWFGWTTW